MNRRGRRAAAEGPRTGLNSQTASTPAALYDAGLQHMGAGRHLDAQICCQQALATDPGHPDSLHLMGLLSLHAGQYEHAMEWLARAIRQNPKTDYLASLGVTLKLGGRLEEALKVFDKTVQLKPDDAELWKHLGGVLVDLNRRADALLSYQQALKLDPRCWEAAYQIGVLLHRSERFEEALLHFNLCDELRPDHAPTLHLRALSLHGLKRYEESLADNRRAHALDPADPVACNNIGDLLSRLGRPEEGLQWFDKALALRPNDLEVLSNKRFTLAHLQLSNGNFESGWAAREARWNAPGYSTEYPKFSQPKWLGGESIEGKTILIHVDEGFGDTIQFARYVPMVAARGARIMLVVQDALHPLLSGLPGVSDCIPFSAGSLPAFDMHCPVTSLPLAFGTRLETIPAATYLPPLAIDRVQSWEDRLGPRKRLRVGLVWSGNPKQANDRNRSMPLRMLTRLLDVEATFVSLQKDPRPDDKALLRDRTDIVDLTAHLTDFVETAALVSCLDLVITVCTSVAHLAGTLGCRTWILLPHVADWRWLLDRDDSPWYPTVRLFRQSETCDYASVVDRVRAELVALAAAFEPTGELPQVGCG
ncbi:MAG: tetratricopeptide repeat protein [Xanthobacteraceae bacterium]